MEHTERFIIEGEDRLKPVLDSDAVAWQLLGAEAAKAASLAATGTEQTLTGVERIQALLRSTQELQSRIQSLGSGSVGLGYNENLNRFTDLPQGGKIIGSSEAQSRLEAATLEVVEAEHTAAAAFRQIAEATAGQRSTAAVDYYHWIEVAAEAAQREAEQAQQSATLAAETRAVQEAYNRAEAIRLTMLELENVRAVPPAQSTATGGGESAVEYYHWIEVAADAAKREADAAQQAAALAAQAIAVQAAQAREDAQIEQLKKDMATALDRQLTALRQSATAWESPTGPPTPSRVMQAATGMNGPAPALPNPAAITEATAATERFTQASQQAKQEITIETDAMGTLVSAYGRAATAATSVATATKGAAESHKSLIDSIPGAAMALGQIEFAAVAKVTEALGALGSELVQAPARLEQWGMTYARIFHNVADAKKELGDLQQIAPQFPQTLSEINDLDQRLLLILGRPAEIQAKFGESLSTVRKDLLDTAAAMGLNSDKLNMLVKDMNDLGEGQNTGQALRSLIQLAGVSKNELADMGVQFDKNGTKIVSSAEQTFSTVLRVMEQKYGGMGEIQSRTFQGMMSNLQDWMQVAASHLGGPLMAELEDRLHSFLQTMNDPAVIANLDLWGDRLGKVLHVAWQVFDAFVQGAQIILTALKPVTDLLFGWIDSWDQTASAQEKAAQAMADAAKISSDGMGETADNATAAADAQDAITRKLRALQDAAAGIKEKYDDALAPLKEQERLLDRIYNAENAQDQIAKIKQEIARDKALAVDTYSSEGRSAAQRLVNEQAELAKDLREQDHTNAKNALDDKVKNLEAERDAKLRGISDEQRRLQDEQAAAREELQWNERRKQSHLDLQKVKTDAAKKYVIDTAAMVVADVNNALSLAGLQKESKNTAFSLESMFSDSKPALGRLGAAIQELGRTIFGPGGLNEAWINAKAAAQQAMALFGDAIPLLKTLLVNTLVVGVDLAIVAWDAFSVAIYTAAAGISSFWEMMMRQSGKTGEADAAHSSFEKMMGLVASSSSSLGAAQAQAGKDYNAATPDVHDALAKYKNQVTADLDHIEADRRRELAKSRGLPVDDGNSYTDDQGTHYSYNDSNQRQYNLPASVDARTAPTAADIQKANVDARFRDQMRAAGMPLPDDKPPAPPADAPWSGDIYGDWNQWSRKPLYATMGNVGSGDFVPGGGMAPPGENGINGQITLVGVDNLGNEQFRQLVNVNRGYISTQIAADIRGRR